MQYISTASGQDGGESVVIWACFIVMRGSLHMEEIKQIIDTILNLIRIV